MEIHQQKTLIAKRSQRIEQLAKHETYVSQLRRWQKDETRHLDLHEHSGTASSYCPELTGIANVEQRALLLMVADGIIDDYAKKVAAERVEVEKWEAPE